MLSYFHAEIHETFISEGIALINSSLGFWFISQFLNSGIYNFVYFFESRRYKQKCPCNLLINKNSYLLDIQTHQTSSYLQFPTSSKGGCILFHHNLPPKQLVTCILVIMKFYNFLDNKWIGMLHLIGIVGAKA